MPANRLDLIAKLPRYRADNYVLDLEDGTPLADKEAARAALYQAVALLREAAIGGRVFVRINALNSDLGPPDLSAAAALDIDGIVVPKIESRAAIEQAAAALKSTGDQNRSKVLIGGIESILGVAHAIEFLRDAPLVAAVYFGAEDLAAELGAIRSPEGIEVIYARQHVLLAAKAAGIAAIDQAVTQFRDRELFAADAQRGRAFGYQGKICLNPLQAELANQLFTPSEEEVDHARRLLAASESMQLEGKGTFSFEGQMIDEPLVRRARAVLAARPGEAQP